jgi:hypothetical protein
MTLEQFSFGPNDNQIYICPGFSTHSTEIRFDDVVRTSDFHTTVNEVKWVLKMLHENFSFDDGVLPVFIEATDKNVHVGFILLLNMVNCDSEMINEYGGKFKLKIRLFKVVGDNLCILT